MICAKFKTLYWISNHEIQHWHGINVSGTVHDYCRDTIINSRINALVRVIRQLIAGKTTIIEGE